MASADEPAAAAAAAAAPAAGPARGTTPGGEERGEGAMAMQGISPLQSLQSLRDMFGDGSKGPSLQSMDWKQLLRVRLGGPGLGGGGEGGG